MKTLLLSILVLATCGTTPSVPSTTYAKLPSQWLQGQAEISSYTLSQNRYKDIHPGKAVMIFVSEPWNDDAQVKSDTGGEGTITVLKNNQIRRFTTGIYDYSLFTSVFTDGDGGLHKVTSSSQDWCGQTWMQVNAKPKQITITQRSYFEKEGDRTTKLRSKGGKAAHGLAEDNLYNMIRLGADLPSGMTAIIPAAHYINMRHIEVKAYDAECTYKEGSKESTYTITYPALDRTVTIRIANDDLRTIVGWTDTYSSAFDNQMRTTVATLDTTIWSAYWEESGVNQTSGRTALGLE